MLTPDLSCQRGHIDSPVIQGSCLDLGALQCFEAPGILIDLNREDESPGTKALPVQGQLDLFVDITFDPVTERATLQYHEVVHFFCNGVIERVIPSCPES